jgi:hypothetical protein
MEGYCAVACLGLADGRDAGEITGAWLIRYDPAGNDGTGDAAWSHDPADAARFTEREWAQLYAAAPANRPWRPDGKPNRPITMFNLAIVPVGPAELPSPLPVPAAAAAGPDTADAELMARLDEIVAAAGGRQAAGEPGPSRQLPKRPVPPEKPGAELAEPGALSESLRRMGLL